MMKSPKQAKPITETELAAIRASAMTPRIGRGGRPESPITARNRGIVDIALCHTMSDAGLRRSEASALIWSDICHEADGSGWLTIRQGKNQPDPRTVYLTSDAIQWLSILAAIRPGHAPHDRIFNLRPANISRRITAACEAAGLGAGYTGHSPRVGMAVRMHRSGAPTRAMMAQGRWKSGRGPSIYTRNEDVGDASRWLD